MKKIKFCPFGKMELKEDEKDFYVSGYVATSHPDNAKLEQFTGDIIPKGTLVKIAEQINNRYMPRAGAISEKHDWIREKNPDLPLAGVIVGPAVLEQLPDKEWAVKADAILSKTHPRYEEIKTNIEPLFFSTKTRINSSIIRFKCTF
ncbi:MAG: hypothetical protein AABY22_21880, partial [Nanoarchaeota archaeon]